MQVVGLAGQRGIDCLVGIGEYARHRLPDVCHLHLLCRVTTRKVPNDDL